MVNKGKDKSSYFVEFEYMPDHPDTDTSNDNGMFVGIAPEITNLDDSRNRDAGHMLRCDSGTFNTGKGWT